MYVPFNQFVISLMRVVIRTQNDPAQLASAVKRAVAPVF